MPVELPEFVEFHQLYVAVEECDIDCARQRLVIRPIPRHRIGTAPVPGNGDKAHGTTYVRGIAQEQIFRRLVGSQRADQRLDAVGEDWSQGRLKYLTLTHEVFRIWTLRRREPNDRGTDQTHVSRITAGVNVGDYHRLLPIQV